MPSDLRTFLTEIDDLLLRVSRPVDLEHVSALIVDARQPILFEDLKGYPGWKLCDLLFRNRACQARVLKTMPAHVLPELARRLSLPPRPPKIVEDGPVKERMFKSEEINLKAIPGFQHGERDMGRVLIAMTLCRDPDNRRMNLAFTRMTPLTETRATYFIGSSPHMRSVLEKYERIGKPMPMAFVVGTHPAFEIMGSYSVPTHLERFGELDMVSGLLDEETEVVPCETIPLEVPAHAELVIEGYVQPQVRVDEGPGPSQALYYIPGSTQQPVFEANMVTMRDHPVLRQINTLLYSDHQTLIALPHEAILFERLREMDLKVHDVQFVPWGGTLCCVIKVTPDYPGQVKDAMMFVLGSRWPNAKMVIAVDDDIDLESPEDLHWSLATRVDPERDVFVLPGMRAHPIDPTARAIEGVPRSLLVGKWAIDATKPPLCHPQERQRFERTLPKHWGTITLDSFLHNAK